MHDRLQLSVRMLRDSRVQWRCLRDRQPGCGAVPELMLQQHHPAPWLRRIHRRSRANMTQLRVVATT